MSAQPPSNSTSNTEKSDDNSRTDSIRDLSKNRKRETLDPQSYPARNSSLYNSRSLSRKSNNVRGMKTGTEANALDQLHEKPPTPPPKHEGMRNTGSPQPRSELVIPLPQPKRGFFKSFIAALASCCTPSAPEHDKKSRNRAQSPRHVKQSVEMESLTKDEDQPTTSTFGVAPPDEEAGLSSQKRDPREPLDEPKPSVVISEDAVTEKEPNGRLITPPLRPIGDDDDDHGTVSTDDGKERELRYSLQVQSPYPTSADEVHSEAVVVSPHVSVSQGTDSDESDAEEIPRQLNSIDEPQPRVISPWRSS